MLCQKQHQPKLYQPTLHNQYCQFCYEKHSSRNCHKEKQLCTIISTQVGLLMEEFVQNKLHCKYCNTFSLVRRNDNSPSLDLECQLCKKKVEVKSKCLSISTLPNDVICKGGNFYHLLNNITNEDLDLVLIIYGVDRKYKYIKIRKVFWISNNQLKNYQLITISKNNNLSIISIADTTRLFEVMFDNLQIISFKEWIEKLIKQI